MSKRVTAPLVVAKLANGSDVYVYEGSPLPDGLKDGEAERLADFLADDSKPAEAEGYASMKVADLKAEIDSRNEGREEADLIPSDGKKADLVAALEADDSK